MEGRKNFWLQVFALVSLTAMAVSCDDGSSATTADVDVGVDTGADADDQGVDEDQADVVDRHTDGWIDGTYTDGREGPPPEHCSDDIDNDSDSLTDCDDSDCETRLVCASGQTLEEGGNSEADHGQLLDLPFIVVGEISEHTETVNGDLREDVDWYRFEVEAPTLIEWEIDDVNGPALPIFTLVGLDDANEGVVRQMDTDTPGAQRQAYLAVPGMYGVQVRDRRNQYRGSDEIPYGAPTFDYAFRIEAATLVAQSQTLPISPEPAQFGEGNALPIFEIELTAGQAFESEVWAERLAPSSGLDAMLYLINTADDSVIGYVDDTPIGTADPLLRTWVFSEDVTALLIVDAWRVDYTSDYELFASQIAPSQDREPNNPIGLAYPALAGDVIDGEIEEPFLRFRSTVTDADYYYYLGGRSASYLVEVSPQGGDLDVSVRTGYLTWSSYGAYLYEMFLADPPDTRAVRLEAVSLANTWFWVEVADRRNQLEEDAEPVGGGAGFEYELRVNGFNRTIDNVVLPLSTTGELSLMGEIDWYEMTIPARSRLEIVADEQTEGVEPYIYLAYQSDSYLTRGSRSLHHLNNVERTYRVGIVDRLGGGGDTYDYDLSISASLSTVETEVEPNDGPPEGGQSIAAPPVWVDGTLTGDNDEDFDVDIYLVALQAGDIVHFETGAGMDTEADNANTTLSLTGPGIDESIEDSDSGFGWYAAISAFEAPQTGSYEISVYPWCNSERCSAGDYVLAIWVE